MIFDMHCDTLCRIREERKKGQDISLRDGKELAVTLERMRQGGYGLQNFAVFIDRRERRDAFENAMELVRIFEEEAAGNADLAAPVRSAGEIEENQRAGRLSMLLTLEEGGMCEGETEKLREFYRHGARMMTICWNYENELGYAAACQDGEGFMGNDTQARGKIRPYGLKETGFAFVEEMEQLGMIPDVSHLSDDGFYDVCEVCRKPFVASHSNARALCAHRRNLTDEMLHRLGDHGGVAGLNYYPAFVTVQHGRDAYLKALAKHAVHMMNCAGREAVGLGSDFDGFGGDSAPEHAADLEALIWAFHREGMTQEETDGILWKNVMRVYRETL